MRASIAVALVVVARLDVLIAAPGSAQAQRSSETPAVVDVEKTAVRFRFRTRLPLPRTSCGRVDRLVTRR